MILVVDLDSVGSRGYYVNPFTVFNMIQQVVKDVNAEHIIFCSDPTKPSFRKDLFPDYKEGRPDTDNRKEYIKVLFKSLKAGGFTVLRDEHDRYEADDLVATVARSYDEVTVLSGDRDLLILVGEGVPVMWYGRYFDDRRIYTEKDMEEEFGIPAKYYVEYKALIGDSSDGYLGVRGIGPARAVDLIGEEFDINNINLDLCTPSIKKAIKETDLKLLIELARLHTVPKFKKMCNDNLLKHSTYSYQKLARSVGVMRELWKN